MKISQLPMLEYMVAHTMVSIDGEDIEILTQVSGSARNLDVPQYSWQNHKELPYETLVFMLRNDMGPAPEAMETFLRVDDNLYRDLRLGDIFSKHWSTIEEAGMGHQDILKAISEDKLPVLEPAERMATIGLSQM